MRIKSLAELEQFKHMSQHNRRQLESALQHSEQVKTSGQNKTSVYSGLDKSHKAEQEKRKKRAEYCLLPEFDNDADPASMLLRESIRRWGHAMQKETLNRPNDVVGELILPGRKFRIDVALLNHRIAIECDGWANHFRKEAVQRDHEKTIFLAKHGWLVLRASTKLIKRELDTFLSDVDEIRATREQGRWSVSYASAGSFYTKLNEWTQI